MRWLGLVSTVICVAGLGAMRAVAQGDPDYGPAEEHIPPYHTHEDRRHGHDHVYPDRGAVVRDLPRGATIVNYAGLSYRFADGVWFEPRGPAYIVVEPPIGLIVPALPGFATTVQSHGKSYLYANDVYYRARPDLGGYEVVNDPADTAPSTSRAHTVGPPGGGDVPPQAEASSRGAAPQISPLIAPTASAASAPQDDRAATVVRESEHQAKAAPQAGTAIEVQRASHEPAALPSSSSSESQSSAPASATHVVALPENGQSPDEQARDRYACYRFAVAQSGFDPLDAQAGVASADAARRQADYARAQAACLEERGYQLR